MQPTLWLKNDVGDIWDLRPRPSRWGEYSSFFRAIAGTGFETKLTFARIQNDFVVTKEEPKQVAIKGTMYFTNPVNMRRFNEFFGNYTRTARLYYDPEGKISPFSQLDRPWYKVVRIPKLESGEQDKDTGLWICEVEFTPLSVMWRRDTTIASTISGIVGDPHIYPYVYPYFYQSERKLYVNILNTGEPIGCRVVITNNNGFTISPVEWTATSDDGKAQYAKWLVNTGLAAGRTLIIDSNPATQQAIVKLGDNEDDINDYQEPNPQYKNFIELASGNNRIMFNLGTTEGVDIEVSYTEQLRAL